MNIRKEFRTGSEPSILRGGMHPAFFVLLMGALLILSLFCQTASIDQNRISQDKNLTVTGNQVAQIVYGKKFSNRPAGRNSDTSSDEMERDGERDEHDAEQVKYSGPMLSSDKYMPALKETGQLQGLQKPEVPTDTDWMAIGPTGDFASDVQTKPTNGRVRSMDIRSINGETYLYVGASSGGIWRSKISTGPVWTSLGDRLPNPSVGAFAIHPNNPDDILVGTGDFSRYAGGGLFHTTDGGSSWLPVTLPAATGSFSRIYYLASGAIIAASQSGVLRFESGNWSIVLNGIVSDLVIHPTNQSLQYCTRATTTGMSDGGVYKSTDGGKSWSLTSATAAPPNQFGVARVAICRDSPSSLAFMYEWGCILKGIRKSTDGGATWTDITSSLLNLGNGQACHAQALAFRPTNRDEIYVGVNEFWKTVDGGNTWTFVPKTIHTHQDYSQLFYSALTGDNVIWLCNDGGVYRYQIGDTDAFSWNGNSQSGLRVSTIADMDAIRNYRVIGLQDDGAVASNNAGGSWSGYTCCDVYKVVVTNDLNPTSWYVQDGRVTKQPFSFPQQDVRDPNLGLNELFYDRYMDIVYSLYQSPTDVQIKSRPATAATPAPWNTELTGLAMGIGAIRGSYLTGKTYFLWGDSNGYLTVVQRNGSTLSLLRRSQIGLVSGVTYTIKNVFASTEQPGESWAAVQDDSGNPKILHTGDYWQTWSDISGSLSRAGQQIWSIAVTPFNSREIFIATDIGVFRTPDGGLNWQPFQTGLPIVQCAVLRYVIDPTHNGNDKLVVATYGRGVYERVLLRPGIVYVDSRNTGFKDGTFEHPYTTFEEGYGATPNNGILALHGNVYSPISRTLNKPITIHTYESLSVIH